MKRFALTFCLLVLPLCLLAQGDYSEKEFFANAITDYISYSRKLEIYPLAFETTLEGKLVIGEKGTPPDLIRLKSDLKFDDEFAKGFGLRWNYTNRTSVNARYFVVKHSSYLRQSRLFKGKKFKSASSFNVKNRWIDLAFTKKIYRKHDEVIEHSKAYSVFGIKTANIDITMRGEEAGQLDKHLYANWEKTFLLPYVGVAGEVRLGGTVNAKAHCLYGNFPTNHGYHVDQYDLGVNLVFDMHRKEKGNLIQLDVGYIKFEQDIHGKGNGALFKFAGPTLALNVIF